MGYIISMLNENAREWIKALRSEKYNKGNGSLRVGDSFCVLGIACDIYAKSHKIIWILDRKNIYSIINHSFTLPDEISKWLGLKTSCASYHRTENSVSTLSLNNDNGMSFKKLADLIESEPKGLFKK